MTVVKKSPSSIPAVSAMEPTPSPVRKDGGGEEEGGVRLTME